MDERMITEFDEVTQIDWREWMLVCTPDYDEAPPVDDSLDFDGILAEIETHGGTAYGLIPWWLVEDERIGCEYCTMPFLW